MRGRRWIAAGVLPLVMAVALPAAAAAVGPVPAKPRISGLTIAADVALGGRPTPVPWTVVLTAPAVELTVELVDAAGRPAAGETATSSAGTRGFAGSVSVDASALPVLGGAHWVVTVWDGGGRHALASRTVAVRFRARGLLGISGQLVHGHRTVVGLARRWSAAQGAYVPLVGQAVEIGLVDHGTLQAWRYVPVRCRGPDPDRCHGGCTRRSSSSWPAARLSQVRTAVPRLLTSRQRERAENGRQRGSAVDRLAHSGHGDSQAAGAKSGRSGGSADAPDAGRVLETALMDSDVIPRRARLRAPELSGRGGWLNTGGRTLALADLRGRFVLVDFWSGCCVNCLHALDELRPVEERFADVLTVVAVHSPKFPHEREHATVVAATERYGVTHPVLDDPDLRTWDAYLARAWPTLVLVDPLGYIVAEYAGEGHAHAISALLTELAPDYERDGRLLRGPSPGQFPETGRRGLRFPGGFVPLSDGGLLVADTARHRLVEIASDLQTELRGIGTGTRGLADGDADTAQFAEPQKLCLLPPEVAAAVGYDVVVADTANHALRGVRLADGSVRTLAGTGRAWLPGDGDEVLSSPWDVEWWQGQVWVALAGTHQLATFDPLTRTCRRVAGTTAEGIRDGELSQAWFAQPSGAFGRYGPGPPLGRRCRDVGRPLRQPEKRSRRRGRCHGGMRCRRRPRRHDRRRDRTLRLRAS